jgi:triacylglycerol esterase/lipase EstA (alpha/beta hydrolase family)
MQSFEEIFRREFFLSGSVLSDDYLKILRSKHVVFVAGLLNEAAQLVGNYYCDNIAECTRLGISHSSIGYLSSYTVPKNADTLLIELHRIYARVKKPIILIGHSKGGAEALYVVLKYPELMLSDLVDRVVLIHPAVGGSPLADDVCNNIGGRSFTKYLGAGLISIQPSTARRLFSEALSSFREILKSMPQNAASTTASSAITDPVALSEDSYKKLSDRVFYVRGASPHSGITWGVKFVIYFCNKPLNPAIPNDGLLHIEDQMLADFGVDLGILQADHIDLVIGTISSSLSSFLLLSFCSQLFNYNCCPYYFVCLKVIWPMRSHSASLTYPQARTLSQFLPFSIYQSLRRIRH